MKSLLLTLGVCMLLAGCAQRPFLGVTISNSPESIESCGARAKGC
jgi:hypothetical protein